MFIITNKEQLANYKKLSDRHNQAENFRLHYNEKATNLIWYGGKIIYIP